MKWAAVAAGSGVSLLDIDLRNPTANAFPTVTALTAWDAWHWEMTKDVLSAIFGAVRIPPSITPVSPEIRLDLGAAASGVSRIIVSTRAVAAGETLNPATLQVETGQDLNIPASRNLLQATFPITETLAGGDFVIVRIQHDGTHANDTLAVNTELYGAYLKVA